jgi:hypothetical protein
MISAKMKYAVVNNTTVVDLTNDEFGAANYATKMNPDAVYLPLAKETDLHDAKYATGRYIISDVRTAQLLEKIKIVSSGYIYNTEKYIITLIDTWTLLDVADVDDKNTVDIQIEQVKLEPVPIQSDPIKHEPVKSELDKEKTLMSDQTQHNTIHVPLFPSSKIISTKIEKNEVIMIPPPPAPQQINTENNKPANIPYKSYNLEVVDIDVISKFPFIFSIGCNSAIQYEKIESVVNTAITSQYVNEDNIYIITNSKRAKNWSHHYPLSFVYEELDVEVLSGIMPRVQNQYISTKPIKKLIIFDNSLTYNFAQKTFFMRLINSCKEYNIALIVLSSNHELSTSNIITKFDYVMLYGVTEKWNSSTSIDFLRTNAITIINDHRSLMYAMLDCINAKNCLTLRANSNKLYQF